MFLCREYELTTLNRRYQSNQCECVIIYGRRRVGKTALILEFAKDKKAILFPALNANATDNLAALSKAIAAYNNPDISSAPVYQSFDNAFAAMQKFTADCVKTGKAEVVMSVVDVIPQEQIEASKKVAESLGAVLRVRKYDS